VKRGFPSPPARSPGGREGKSLNEKGPPASPRLIHDVLVGDRSLFTRPDGLAHVWEVAGDLLTDKPEPAAYPQGSWGPEAAQALAGPDGWILQR